MTTPLYTALRRFAAEAPLRLHMPGHKGKPLCAPELAAVSALDFTELAPTGDLFSPGGAIGAAEALWAEAFRMAQCFFLTGGSTQGVHTALALACRPGETILLDRMSHRSAYTALALLDLHPVFLDRPWRDAPGVAGEVIPKNVDKYLQKHPDIQTVCITSPTYYGVLSDIPAIVPIVHAHGAKLVVDAAHGAHLPFLGNHDLAAADLVVTSAHKTLPALGQSALLFAGDDVSPAALRRTAALFGSSSPSYPLMASLDLARAYLEDGGAAAYAKTAAQVARLREKYPALRPADAALDPTRLTLLSPDGNRAAEALARQGIYVELADRGHVVCILTCMDDAADCARLDAALAALPWGATACPAPPPVPELCLSPRTAFFAAHEACPLAHAVGQISASQIAPYPPGIPVLAPGERVEKKTIAYLDQIGYNMEEDIEVVRL